MEGMTYALHKVGRQTIYIYVYLQLTRRNTDIFFRVYLRVSLPNGNPGLVLRLASSARRATVGVPKPVLTYGEGCYRNHLMYYFADF